MCSDIENLKSFENILNWKFDSFFLRLVILNFDSCGFLKDNLAFVNLKYVITALVCESSDNLDCSIWYGRHYLKNYVIFIYLPRRMVSGASHPELG